MKINILNSFLFSYKACLYSANSRKSSSQYIIIHFGMFK